MGGDSPELVWVGCNAGTLVRVRVTTTTNEHALEDTYTLSVEPVRDAMQQRAAAPSRAAGAVVAAALRRSLKGASL